MSDIANYTKNLATNTLDFQTKTKKMHTYVHINNTAKAIYKNKPLLLLLLIDAFNMNAATASTIFSTSTFFATALRFATS